MARTYDHAELWICLNCRNIGGLTQHGRCATCDSDSVAVADMGRPPVQSAASDIAELERMFGAPAPWREKAALPR